ncbi:MAG: DoxX family membrane protein [Bifidobacteriaceae bacterium]|jgi:uncharacterized membrane protein YphA (DoxX/SURF4 family)|nr:DoxX family membrane protein [Bifidobacteriaceae bacterium]
MSLIRVKARALIGAAAIADGVAVLRHPEPHEEVAAATLERLEESTGKTVPATVTVRATAIAQLAGGSLIATSLAPRLGALASLGATVPALLLGYRFWKVKDDPAVRDQLRAGFWLHLLLTGADLLVLAGPTRRHKRRKDRSRKTAKNAKAASRA